MTDLKRCARCGYPEPTDVDDPDRLTTDPDTGESVCQSCFYGLPKEAEP